MADGEKKFDRRTFLNAITKTCMFGSTLSLGATVSGVITEDRISAIAEKYCHPAARKNKRWSTTPWVDYHPPRDPLKKYHADYPPSNDDKACIAVVNTGKEVDNVEISVAIGIGSSLAAVIARHFSRQGAAGTPDNGQSRS